MGSDLSKTTMQQSGLIKTENGFAFRDLNKNGRLDIYEDPRQPVEARVNDLLSQMTLEEKAGMFLKPMTTARNHLGLDLGAESGQSVETEPGTTFMRMENWFAVFDVDSGSYTFSSKSQS